MTHYEGATGLTRGAKGGKLRVSPAQGISFPVAPQEPPAPWVARLLLFHGQFLQDWLVPITHSVEKHGEGVNLLVR